MDVTYAPYRDGDGAPTMAPNISYPLVWELGSEYGKWGKEIFLETEALAKAQRVGQWVNGTDVETPAEYKRRHARSLSKSPSIPDAVVDEDLDIVEEESDIVEEYEIAVEPKTRTTRSRRKSWWKRLFEPGNRKR
ncbi:hypothetical protein EW145_g3860 [Phellinidium pouzarii]|uniref:Uncharacterized protein n=1 Tax=Phellinidium pouzarii TaxID=167371 RepID=A0A4S4L635_9AGAM|nr:hypothetical protein EW145_g3860 [Phellinidium pouzarii]